MFMPARITLRHLSIVPVLLIIQVSCSSLQPTADPPGYTDYPGKAAITELTQTQDYYVAKFDFSITDPNAKTKWLHPKGNQAVVRNPNGPTTIESMAYQGIYVGAELPCTYSEIISGSSTPAIFRFPTNLWIH